MTPDEGVPRGKGVGGMNRCQDFSGRRWRRRPASLRHGTIAGAGSSTVWLLVVFVVIVTARAYAEEVTPAAVARRIDQHLMPKPPGEGVSFVDDPAFLRRLTLDLAGRIPAVSEVYEYFEQDTGARRHTAVRRLMQSGIYYRNMTTFWRRSWVPQADTREFAAVTDGFEVWLFQRLRDGARYDELVADILTQDRSADGSASSGPRGFYDANLAKPENLAASSSRAFMGLNLDCAQCHNHPYSRWTREQFWQTAAFFAVLSTQDLPRSGPPKIRIPETKTECEPVFLTPTDLRVPPDADSLGLRQTLVAWMKHDGDRWMAKNAVNRLWSHFFGEAIIEPMDDLSAHDAQSGPRAALLDDLASMFIASGYDLDVMVEGIVSSQPYRLPSATASRSDYPLTTVPIRGLTGEQLYDSLQVAAGLPVERMDLGFRGSRSPRREFASRFYVERTHGAERSITQALALMNGSLVNDMTTAKGNPFLASLLTSAFMRPDDQIDTVFLAVLSRHATAAETEAVRKHFNDNPALPREDRLGGLFWALVNTAEFSTNH